MKPGHRSNAGRRHDDGPIPPDRAQHIRRDRQACAQMLVLIGLGALAALTLCHMAGVGL